VDSRLIEYFLRVAELGSINRAATDLRLSQPALSRHIALLEHQLRAKLFTRTRGGVQLTEAGTLLRRGRTGHTKPRIAAYKASALPLRPCLSYTGSQDCPRRSRCDC